MTRLWWAFAALAVVRAVYPRLLELRQARRRPTGADGIIVGAASVALHARGGRAAVLLLHGAGDTPSALSGLAVHLQKAGYAVRAPLLANHGRPVRRMHHFDAPAWRAQVRQEYDALRAQYRWVGVAGLSMGGALALDLAAERADIPALVLFAPWVDMSRLARRLARTSRIWGPLLPYLPSLAGESIHDPEAARRSLSHGLVTPASLRALHQMAILAQDSLARVRVPTLVMQSREDNRIAATVASRAFDRIGAADKRFVWMEGAGHVITADFGKERVFELTAEWLTSHGGP